MAVPEANLPEDIDATHDDRRPSDALHQQHHDLIHRVINALAGTGLDTEIAALAADETSQLRGAFNDAYAKGLSAAEFGIVGDGDPNAGTGTDNTAALQAAIDAAAAADLDLYIPAGWYRVTGTLSWPSRLTIRGDSPSRCTIFQTAADTPIIASESWLNNSEPAGKSGLRDMRLVGAAGAGAHGVILRDFYSTIQNLEISGCGGDGLRLDEASVDGTIVGFTLVENHYRDLFIEDCAGIGFYQKATSAILTDSFVTNLVVRGGSASERGIVIPYSAGWQIRGVHTYGSFAQYAVHLGRMWGSVLDGAQIESGWTTAGLTVSVQRAALLDNVSVAVGIEGDGGTMVELSKDGTNPGADLGIGTLSLVSSSSALTAVTGVTWDTTGDSEVWIANLLLSGEDIENITLLGGFGATNIRTYSPADHTHTVGTVSVGPGQMAPILGSPTIGLANRTPVYLLAGDVNGDVGGVVVIPEGWASAHVDLWWTNVGAGSGNVVFRCDIGPVTDGSPAPDPTSGSEVVATAPAQNVVETTRLRTGVGVTPGFTVFEAIRLATVAGDTLANDVGVIGVVLTRAS